MNAQVLCATLISLSALLSPKKPASFCKNTILYFYHCIFHSTQQCLLNWQPHSPTLSAVSMSSLTSLQADTVNSIYAPAQRPNRAGRQTATPLLSGTCSPCCRGDVACCWKKLQACPRSACGMHLCPEVRSMRRVKYIFPSKILLPVTFLSVVSQRSNLCLLHCVGGFFTTEPSSPLLNHRK